MRLILLLVGLVIIFLIYVVSRFQVRRTAAIPQRSGLRAVPATDDQTFSDRADHDDNLDAELDQLGRMIAEDDVCDSLPGSMPAEQTLEAGPPGIFSLFVMAPQGVPFRGSVLLGALARAGLEFGDMDIYHRTGKSDGRERLLFSAANVREPGTFNLAAMENFTTEGIVLFMQVQGAGDAVAAFDAMVVAARNLSDSLDSPVSDASRSLLTSQILSHMREEVISCQLQLQMAKTAS